MNKVEFDKDLYEKARYLAQLVQGNQFLEGATLDESSFEKLVELAVEMLKEKRKNANKNQ